MYQFQHEIISVRQGNNSMTVYYNCLKKLLEELSSLDIFLDCVCGALTACTYNFVEMLVEILNKNKCSFSWGLMRIMRPLEVTFYF